MGIIESWKSRKSRQVADIFNCHKTVFFMNLFRTQRHKVLGWIIEWKMRMVVHIFWEKNKDFDV